MKNCKKIWYRDLVFKSKQNGISGELLNILEDFGNNRKIAENSILGSPMFQIYINNLANDRVHEAVFSKKEYINKTNHQDMAFNRKQHHINSSWQNHLEMFLYSKLDFKIHIKSILDSALVNLLALSSSSYFFCPGHFC